MQVPLIALLLFAPSPQNPAPAPALAPAQDLTVTVDGQAIGAWRLDGRVPYFSPLLGPGGIPVTRPVPAPEIAGKAADHPHHVSFWTAHGDVNGVDFWHDPEARIQAKSCTRTRAKDGSVQLRADLVWLGPGGQPIVLEERTLHFHGPETERLIDRTHVFRAPAAEPVVFGDTKEGTFALRLRSELRPDRGAKLRNDAGQSGGEAWGQAARWVAYEGQVDGQPLGVAMLAHPDNPGGAVRWHARTYGLFAANPFGQRGFAGKDAPDGARVLAPGKTWTYRWRTVVYAGQRSPEQLNALLQRW